MLLFRDGLPWKFFKCEKALRIQLGLQLQQSRDISAGNQVTHKGHSYSLGPPPPAPVQPIVAQPVTPPCDFDAVSDCDTVSHTSCGDPLWNPLYAPYTDPCGNHALYQVPGHLISNIGQIRNARGSVTHKDTFRINIDGKRTRCQVQDLIDASAFFGNT